VLVKPGTRLRSAACGTKVVVVRAPDRDLVITCCDGPLVERDEATTNDEAPDDSLGGEESVLIGKRYSDEDTGLEVLCTKAGSGPLACQGRPLTANAPKPLPSSD
jgi:hypothetical protein